MLACKRVYNKPATKDQDWQQKGCITMGYPPSDTAKKQDMCSTGLQKSSIGLESIQQFPTFQEPVNNAKIEPSMSFPYAAPCLMISIGRGF